MKAAVCTAYGPPEVVTIMEIPKPVTGKGDILIKVAASAVNSGDVRVRGLAVTGLMRVMMWLVLGFSKPRKPVLGVVYSGQVEETGPEVTEFKPGDEVFGLSGFRFGGHAEYISVPAKSIIVKKPVNASFQEAAAIAFGGQTAHFFLHQAGISKRVKPEVLIMGATGAVGSAAVQIAKYYHASVTAVCSSAGKELALRLGADKVILYDKEDFTKTPGRFDVVFDTVDKAPKKICAHLVKPGGVYTTVGGMNYAKESREQLEFVKRLFEEGKYQAAIDKVYTLEQIMEAHRYVDAGRKKANVVLVISN
ncbi:MAG: NAD(P)-dependent alcohol dehydrogenase [Ignavibacteriaceae bacterium]|nr:NAD(P)-dependent alcohol dehydrogenase [Ignavibacteriaceae bacterium]